MRGANAINRMAPRSRVAISGVLAVVVVLGLASRKYAGFIPEFFAIHSGDALWTVAVVLSLAFLRPSWSAWPLGLIAFGISVGVELSQLLDWRWLNAIRRTTLGGLVLGHGFIWIDLLRYFIGALLAALGLAVWDRCRNKPQKSCGN